MEEKKALLPAQSFIILNIATFNLYSIWWMYKSWTFFKYRETYDIQPAMRAIFSIFFIFGLFERIRNFSGSFGYEAGFKSAVLFVAILLVQLMVYLPEEYWLVSYAAGFLYALPVKALNEGIRLSGDYETEEQIGFTKGETIAIVVGSLMWVLVLIGLFFGDEV